MAASLSAFLKPWTPRFLVSRWVRYNPYYLDPDVRKETYSRSEAELSETEKQQQDEKRLRPIKAAKNSDSSSVFYDPDISKFTNMIMKKGEKRVAREIMSETLETIKRTQLEKYHKAQNKEEIECNPYNVFHRALDNVTPVVGLMHIRRGGKNYQVPVPLKDGRRRFLAMRWIISECRGNKHRRTAMSEKLSAELLAASIGEGNVFKKKLELHKTAEANRAYAHYRW